MKEGLWTVFCDDSESSAKKSVSSLISPYSCSHHILIISVDVLLLLIAVSIFICKSVSRKIAARSQSQRSSPVMYVSTIFNGILSLVYLGWGIWMISDKLGRDQTILPLHGWLTILFQGFTWLVINLLVSLKKVTLPQIAAVKFCLVIAILFSGFLCISSIWGAVSDKTLSVPMLLDILSFPGAILFLFCGFKRQSYTGTDLDISDGTSYEPLPGEEDNANGEISSNDNITPFANAGFFSQMSFWWLNPLLKKGKEKILEDGDIPQLREADQAKNCYLMYTEQLGARKQKGSSNSLSMLSVIISLHWKKILISGIFALIKVLSLATGPLFLKAFIDVAEGKAAFEYEGYVLTAGLFLAKVLESLSERHWHFQTRLIGIQVRSMLSAAIYQKQLRLSNAAKVDHSSGEIVSYVAVDAYRIGEFPFWFHQIWATSIQLCLALAIVYYSIGLATMAALATVILLVLSSYPLIKLQHKYLTKLMVAQDRRLKAITEALANMKILKLYAWETHFKNVVDGLRKEEFQWISGVLWQKGYHMVLFWSSPVVVPAITFWACYLLGIPVSASSVFTFLACLRIVQEPIRLIPDVAGVFIEAKVSLDRIVKFLEAPELRNSVTRQKLNGEELDQSILIRATEISWGTDSSSKATLRNINFLEKFRKITGIVHVFGKIAYVSQTAWIQTGTIQENILFGAAMEPVRYQEVLERCSLVKDIEIFPFGDLTEIGERGVNLSGGQKQRVQLARALYQDADVYLLDDPFSAVDAQTATSLFNDYVIGALSGKTVLLVTHQIDFLPAFNSILLMSGGEIIRSDTYSQLMASSQEFQDLVNAHKNTAGSDTQVEYDSSKRAETSKTEEIQKVRSIKKLGSPSGDQLIKREEKESGDTGSKPYIQYLSQRKGFLYFSLGSIVHIIFIVGQVIQSYWLAANIQNSDVSRVTLFTVYSVIGCSLAVFLLLRSVFIVQLGCGASETIFSTLLTSLFRAPMSFYDSTPLGRILSRVSSDLSVTDLEMAFRLTIAVGTTMNTYFNFAVLAFLTWPVLFAIIPMIYLNILLQRYYFASAKELTRINGTSKSSVASHLAESIAGATTIRAFGEEARFFSKYLDLIDRNASPYFHSFTSDEWLIQRLELLCAIVLSSSTLAIILLHFSASASGFIGMELSYGLSLNNLFNSLFHVADCFVVLEKCHLREAIQEKEEGLNSSGILVEYDEPLKLMNKEGSLFGQLVREYWSRTANSRDW
ncbi:ATP-BINDING CASSETTE SUB-FAMILY C [Salix purpurea]|uniref:ABC-type xenobiotic transporter n=1 Tax=Salix purpurea TaxID=77065 RepID=A0A9Q0TJ34_SALPP|nr:ATP-BINDING CASSETTE SUB-FAMILY C [Salix purpurea]